MLPDAGDIAWVDLDPVKGTEQAGRRPAVVLSARIYHQVSKRAVVCPVTSNAHPWSFNLVLPEGLKTSGVVLIDQIRTIDRSERMFAIIERVPDDVMSEIRARLGALLRIAEEGA